MKTITLNIGLNTNDGGKVPIHEAINCLNFCGVQILESRVVNSPNGDDQTLIIVTNARDINQPTVYELAQQLRQDCIAISNGKRGELIGPNAAKWGQFNKDFFIQFNPQKFVELPPGPNLIEALRRIR